MSHVGICPHMSAHVTRCRHMPTCAGTCVPTAWLWHSLIQATMSNLYLYNRQDPGYNYSLVPNNKMPIKACFFIQQPEQEGGCQKCCKCLCSKVFISHFYQMKESSDKYFDIVTSILSKQTEKNPSNAWCKCLWKLHCDYTAMTVALFSNVCKDINVLQHNYLVITHLFIKMPL